MLTKEQGIQAIIELQAFIGIKETREKAEKGWENMAEWEKAETESVHQICCGGFQKDAMSTMH